MEAFECAGIFISSMLYHIGIYIRSNVVSCHALFRDGSHSGTNVCMLDWFSNKIMYVPWISVAKIHDKLSFLHRVCGKSITALFYY